MAGNQHLPNVQIEQFHGRKSENVKDWFRRFETLCAAFGFNDDRRLNVAQVYLRDTAEMVVRSFFDERAQERAAAQAQIAAHQAQVAAQPAGANPAAQPAAPVDPGDVTYPQLRERLIQVLAGVRDERLCQRELARRRQEPAENAKEFGLALLDLAKRSYPNMPLQDQQGAALQRFIEGINEKFRHHLALREYDSLMDAIRDAETLQSIEDDRKARIPGVNVLAAEMTPSGALDMSKISHQLADIQKRMLEGQSPRPAMTGKSGELICFRCQNPGHMARDCKLPPPSRASGPPSRVREDEIFARASSGRCRNCGGQGHFARECPSSSAGARPAPRLTGGNSQVSARRGRGGSGRFNRPSYREEDDRRDTRREERRPQSDERGYRSEYREPYRRDSEFRRERRDESREYRREAPVDQRAPTSHRVNSATALSPAGSQAGLDKEQVTKRQSAQHLPIPSEGAWGVQEGNVVTFKLDDQTTSTSSTSGQVMTVSMPRLLSGASVRWMQIAMVLMCLSLPVSGAKTETGMKATNPLLCESARGGLSWAVPDQYECSVSEEDAHKPPHSQTLRIYKENVYTYKSEAFLCTKIRHVFSQKNWFFRDNREVRETVEKHQVSAEECQSWVKQKKSEWGHLVQSEAQPHVWTVSQPLDKSYGSFIIGCCKWFTREAWGASVHQTIVSKRHSDLYPVSPVAELVGCKYESGKCSLPSGQLIYWKVNETEECAETPWRSLHGTRHNDLWISADENWAFTFRNAREKEVRCQQVLTLTDQGVWVREGTLHPLPALAVGRRDPAKKRDKREEGADEGFSVVNDRTLAARLQAMADYVDRALKQAFLINAKAICALAKATFHNMRAQLMTEPTAMIRQLAGNDPVIATFSGGVIQVSHCLELGEGQFWFPPHSLCYGNYVPITYFLAGRNHSGYLDTRTNRIQTRVRRTSCEGGRTRYISLRRSSFWLQPSGLRIKGNRSTLPRFPSILQPFNLSLTYNHTTFTNFLLYSMGVFEPAVSVADLIHAQSEDKEVRHQLEVQSESEWREKKGNAAMDQYLFGWIYAGLPSAGQILSFLAVIGLIGGTLTFCCCPGVLSKFKGIPHCANKVWQAVPSLSTPKQSVVIQIGNQYRVDAVHSDQAQAEDGEARTEGVKEMSSDEETGDTEGDGGERPGSVVANPQALAIRPYSIVPPFSARRGRLGTHNPLPPVALITRMKNRLGLPAGVGLPIVKVLIKEVEIDLILDTGSTNTIISRSLLSHMQTPQLGEIPEWPPLVARTCGGNIPITSSFDTAISIPGIPGQIYWTKIFVTPEEYLATGGLLGNDVLSRMGEFSLDLNRRYLKMGSAVVRLEGAHPGLPLNNLRAQGSRHISRREEFYLRGGTGPPTQIPPQPGVQESIFQEPSTNVFMTAGSYLPFLEVTIRDTTLHMLVDTGSTITFIQEGMVDKINEKKARLPALSPPPLEPIRGEDCIGRPIVTTLAGNFPLEGAVRGMIKVGEAIAVTHTLFYVQDEHIPWDGVLGQDFLARLGTVTICYRSKTLTVGNITRPMPLVQVTEHETQSPERVEVENEEAEWVNVTIGEEGEEGGQLAFVDVYIGDNLLTFLLDSASTITLIKESALLGLPPDQDEGAEINPRYAQTCGGPIRLGKPRHLTLTVGAPLGPVLVARMYPVSEETFPFPWDGVLGTNVWAQLGEVSIRFETGHLQVGHLDLTMMGEHHYGPQGGEPPITAEDLAGYATDSRETISEMSGSPDMASISMQNQGVDEMNLEGISETSGQPDMASISMQNQVVDEMNLEMISETSGQPDMASISTQNQYPSDEEGSGQPPRYCRPSRSSERENKRDPSNDRPRPGQDPRCSGRAWERRRAASLPGNGSVTSSGSGSPNRPSAGHVYNSIPLKGVDLPLIDIKLGDKVLPFLFDTGASVSLVPFSTFRKLNIPACKSWPVMEQVNALSGAVLGTHRFRCNVKLGSTDLGEQEFLVVHDSACHFAGILGNDISAHAGELALNMKGRYLKVNSDVLPVNVVHTVAVNLPPTVVRCYANVVIPPNSGKTIKARLDPGKGRAIPITPEERVCEPNWKNLEKLGIMMPRSVIMTSSLPFSMALENPTPSPVTVYANQSLAWAEPVSLVLPPSTPEKPTIAHVMLPKEEEGRDGKVTPPAKALTREELVGLFNWSEVDVTAEQRVELENLLWEHRSAFARDKYDLGHCGIIKMEIDTGDAPPVRTRPSRIPEAYKEEVKTQLTKMLEKNILRPSVSPWSSNLIIVKKPDGSLRMCVDFRRLNAVTRRDSYPLPVITTLLDSLGKANVFSSADLASGFWQVALSEEAKPKCAIASEYGLYEFTVCPFGLMNLPSQFQRLMAYVLAGLQHEIVLVYLDDLIIFSEDFPSHLRDLSKVFSRLEQFNLKAKPSKVSLCRKEIQFLGHRVSREGLQPDDSKVRAIMEMESPTDLKSLQAALGMLNFYRKFILGYSNIAAPLNGLLKKGENFRWTEQHETAYRTLVKKLVEAPILALPDFTKKFTLTTDASSYALGAVLSQEKEGHARSIAYASRVLSKAEKGYSVTQKEALAAVWGIEYFKEYLLGREFVLVTDHSALKTILMSGGTDSARLQRWALKLQEYTFTVQYKKGSSNTADGLSRLARGSLGQVNALGGTDRRVTFNVETEEEEAQGQSLGYILIDPTLRTAQRRDSELQKIIALLEGGEVPEDEAEAEKVRKIAVEYEMGLANCLYRKEPNSGFRHRPLAVPKELTDRILKEHHEGMGGHLGFARTIFRIRRMFHWPSMYRDVRGYVEECQVCQQTKSALYQPRAPMVPWIPAAPWNRLFLDILGPITLTERGNRFIICFQDAATAFPEAFAVPDTKSSRIAEVMFSEIFCRYGAPAELCSDQGKNLLAKVVNDLNDLFQVRRLTTAGYRPQTNGQIEVTNRVMGSMLRAFCMKRPQDWDLYLPAALLALRSSVQASRGESPAFLTFGRDIHYPAEALQVPQPRGYREVDDFRADLVLALHDANLLARENLIQSQARNKKYFDEKVRGTDFVLGQRVWLEKPASAAPPGTSRKLWIKREGPFRIVSIKDYPNAEIVPCDKPRSKPKTVHVARLRPCYSPHVIEAEVPVPERREDKQKRVSEERTAVELLFPPTWMAHPMAGDVDAQAEQDQRPPSPPPPQVQAPHPDQGLEPEGGDGEDDGIVPVGVQDVQQDEGAGGEGEEVVEDEELAAARLEGRITPDQPPRDWGRFRHSRDAEVLLDDPSPALDRTQGDSEPYGTPPSQPEGSSQGTPSPSSAIPRTTRTRALKEFSSPPPPQRTLRGKRAREGAFKKYF